MVVKEFTIPYKSLSDIIKIKPIPDVHYGNTYCDKRAFYEYISDDTAYYLCIGDLFDAIIPSDTKRYVLHGDESKKDDAIDSYVNQLTKILKPIADSGRLIGLGSGNHESKFLKHHGTSLMGRLCDNLNCTHLGYSWLIRLVLDGSTKEKRLRTRTLVIRGHHGWGGGSRTQGGDLTKYSKDVAYWDADIFLYGHVHRLQDDEIIRWGLSGTKAIVKPKLMGICGTFLKTLSPNEFSTYSEERGYPPTTIGGQTLNIKITNRWARYWFSRD